MNQALSFLLQHGYWVVFAFVLAEQIGLPVPAAPVLLAMGALAGAGKLSFLTGVAIAVAASLLSDSVWYLLGKRRGYSVLNLLCRIALEPDSCVRRTEEVFDRFGARALLVAKFVPGLSTVAPPMAGLFGMKVLTFVLADAAGSALWVTAFGGAGWIFRRELVRVAEFALSMGSWLSVVLAALLALYVLFKTWERQRFLRRLRIARITPEELMHKLEAREEVIIVDLRHPRDVESQGTKLPGALHMAPTELDTRHQEIPRDRDIVLYCS
jgi:membrane protein DedA with SNARE-associated domain